MRSPLRRAGLAVAALVQLHLGPTTTQQAVDQITRSSMRPLPSVAPSEAPRPRDVWVPEHWAHGDLRVPAHWEHRLPDGRLYVPPLIVTDPRIGGERLVPGHVDDSPNRQQKP
jgi:hypothetical protein